MAAVCLEELPPPQLAAGRIKIKATESVPKTWSDFAKLEGRGFDMRCLSDPGSAARENRAGYIRSSTMESKLKNLTGDRGRRTKNGAMGLPNQGTHECAAIQ